jgi:hypothetical protein
MKLLTEPEIKSFRDQGTGTDDLQAPSVKMSASHPILDPRDHAVPRKRLRFDWAVYEPIGVSGDANTPETGLGRR